MKNRLFAIILSTVLLVCTLATPLCSFAADRIPNADGGGFDFYSITVHYDKPTVLQYVWYSAADSRKEELIYTYGSTGRKSYVQGWVFAEPEDTYVIRSGDSLGAKGTAYKTYQSTVLTDTGYTGNFQALTGNGHTSDVFYTTFPNQYGYVHNIHNNDLIQTVNPVSLRGVTEIVDDAMNKNPNIEFGEDGYAKDVDGGRIDYNGYLLDENDNWYTIDSNGKKETCQLFRETSAGDLVPVSRFDEDGMIIKVSKYDNAQIYVVDENGEIAKDSQGNRRNATPEMGTPVMKTNISKITVEIDALGTQLYDDLASDPQQKNTITISLGNAVDNIEIIPESGTVIGTAKSVTTRTEATFSKRFEPTVVSVEVDATEEVLNSISPAAKRLYVQFGVEEIQGADAYLNRIIMANNSDLSKGFKSQALKLLTEEDISRYVTPSPEPSATPDNSIFSEGNMLYVIIGGAAILVLVIVIIVIIIVVCSKKKKKKAVGSKEEAKADDSEESAQTEVTEVTTEATEETEPTEKE